ncbi:SusC/RagA family TonB-linked outer membrane protein [Spirosoma validum]|uniref:SusC/RagA family TonB-linked outer membrane protein n=1 Tax=Spirosoma validum TaxID=2771355 RepID=A0A927B7Z0_9BACT|nr:SusC/RagA family TonB-linked outer membrane protein [Spirosoma validum]MBD2756871.1 SusC/RagA family TonB-linked outer membrane protein [Spirosoma validum]
MRKILLGSWLLSLLFCLPVLAQDVSVSGQVTSSDDGSGLPGVTVQVKGESRGTTTDAQGNYRINAPATSTLVFSFIGYKSQEVAVGNRSTIAVTLQTDATNLNEVVVTAIGFEREKKSLGYAINTVKNEELTVGRTTNLVNSLQGKVAGVRIQSSSGQVGASSAIFIRGFTTFTGSNQPLFVVDGIPIDNSGGTNSLQNGVANSNRGIDLNQDEIENLSVLKGPAAAALYGSRAASGAIIITTKKGRRNAKTSVQLTSSYNVNEVNRFPDWQNQYAQGSNGSTFNNLSNFSWGPRIQGQRVANPFTSAVRQLIGMPDSTNLTSYPDNIRNVFRQGNNFQKNVAITGGNERSTFRVSYGNLVENGTLANNRLVRNNFRFNGSSQITSKFTAGVSAEYITSTSKRTQVGNQLSNPFFRTWFLPRNIDLQNLPYQDAAGTQYYFDTSQDNPYWTIDNNRWNDQVNRVLGNINLGYDITPWLNASYKIGIDNYTQTIKAYDQIGAVGAATTSAGGRGGIRDETFQTKNLASYLNLSVKRQITEDLGFNLVVGNEITQLYSNRNRITGTTLNVRDFDNITNATVYTPFAEVSMQRLIGVYGDFSLNYKQWLTVNVTGRNDWSSTFGRAKRSFFYPGVAASFVFTEAFPSLKNGGAISFGKLYVNRAKGGKVAPVYSTDTYFLQAQPADGFGPQILFPFQQLGGRTLDDAAGNSDLGPEFTTSSEIGLEMSFLRDRIGFEFAYYDQHSTDLIFAVPISPSSGFTSAYRNAGSMRSRGVEFLLRGTPIRTTNLTWNLSANFSHVDPRVESLAAGVPNIFLGGFTTPQARLEEGQPYGIIYGSVLNRDANGRVIVTAQGLPTQAAANQRIGNPNPQWTMGITSDLSFRGFNLNFLIDIRKGGDAYARNIGDLRRTGAAIETAEFDRFNADGTQATPYIIDGVKADGSVNTTRLTAQQYWQNLYTGIGETYIFDTSWMRLREASLSYSFTNKLLTKTPLGQLQIGINGRNLLLSAPNYPHFDPENSVLGASNGQGLEFNSLPQTRSYGVFLKASF